MNILTAWCNLRQDQYFKADLSISNSKETKASLAIVFQNSANQLQRKNDCDLDDLKSAFKKINERYQNAREKTPFRKRIFANTFSFFVCFFKTCNTFIGAHDSLTKQFALKLATQYSKKELLELNDDEQDKVIKLLYCRAIKFHKDGGTLQSFLAKRYTIQKRQKISKKFHRIATFIRP